MKPHRLLAGLALAAMVWASPARCADDALHWSLRYMLINGTTDATLFGATHEVANDGALRTPEMHELLAEVLAEIHEHDLPAQDTALNIVRILAAAPDAGRYQTLIAAQKKFITSKGITPLLAKYLAAYPRPKGEQFVPGKVDFMALRKQYTEAALMAKPSAKQVEALRNLRKDASMDRLFEEAGLPSLVLPRDTRAARQFGNVDVRQMVFYYRGVGRISYELSRDTWKPLVLEIDTLAFEDLMPYRRDPKAYGMPDDDRLAMMQLLSGTPQAMRMSAIAVHRMAHPPAEYLDTAAEILVSSHVTAKDDLAIDAYAWLCRVLNHHGARRYAPVLARVASETHELKLRGYATKVRNPSGPKQPAYVPGSVSLEAQRAKFPSMYAPVAPT